MPVNWNDAAFQEKIRRAANAGVAVAAEVVRSEAIDLILDTPKTGRIYRRRGVEHQASAPGEAPASDTGRLVNSIAVELEPERLAATIGPRGVEYGAYLEFGTQKMEPRPFMRPALANVREEITGIINEAIREGAQ